MFFARPYIRRNLPEVFSVFSKTMTDRQIALHPAHFVRENLITPRSNVPFRRLPAERVVHPCSLLAVSPG
jgi:hypothetical protein